MKNLLMKTMGLAAGAVVYSHAIFGIGGQWAPAPGLSVKASNDVVAGSGTSAISIDQKSVSGLNGFGVKLWVDAIPFIDLEAGSNIQFGTYDLALVSSGGTLPVKFDVGVPLVPNKPVYARIVNDLTVLYPFLKLPPLVSILKLYAGAGVSYGLTTEVLNAKFGKKAVDDAIAKSGATAADSPEKVSTILVKAIENNGLKSGMGFHLEAGAKAKIPVIPIAVFANAKYHMLSSMPSAVDANSLTLELGGALAF